MIYTYRVVSMSKDTRYLKAIHNIKTYHYGTHLVVSMSKGYRIIESNPQQKSVFAGIGNAEILADFLHEKVFYFRMSWYSRFLLCKRIHIHTMPASLSVKDTVLAGEVT